MEVWNVIDLVISAEQRCFLLRYGFNKQLTVNNKIYTVSSSDEEVYICFNLNTNLEFRIQETGIYLQCFSMFFVCLLVLVFWYFGTIDVWLMD